jgi:hypothetical protein
LTTEQKEYLKKQMPAMGLCSRHQKMNGLGCSMEGMHEKEK